MTEGTTAAEYSDEPVKYPTLRVIGLGKEAAAVRPSTTTAERFPL